MPMYVVHVRHVRMRMPQWRMPMGVRMRLARRIARPMHVLMECVMHMWMGVVHQKVVVVVLVDFSHVQPDADGHQ